MTLYSTVGLIVAALITAGGITLKLYLRRRLRELDGFVGVAQETEDNEQFVISNE